MVLIYAGAYQGKLAFAKRAFGMDESQVFSCDSSMEKLDFDKPVIYGLEKFIYGYQTRADDAEYYIRENLHKLRDKIIICEDISRGLVPMDKVERAWRESNGRIVNMLAAEADRVYTVFCGIESKVK